MPNVARSVAQSASVRSYTEKQKTAMCSRFRVARPGLEPGHQRFSDAVPPTRIMVRPVRNGSAATIPRHMRMPDQCRPVCSGCSRARTTECRPSAPISSAKRAALPGSANEGEAPEGKPAAGDEEKSGK